MNPWIIRPAQMRVLEEEFLLQWLHAQVRGLFPKECAALGPGGLGRFVSAGVKRARDCEFTRDDLLPYLSLEICYGEAFLEEEWARQAMSGPSAGRMQRLRRAGIFRLAARAERERRQQTAWAAARAQQEAERAEEEPADA